MPAARVVLVWVLVLYWGLCLVVHSLCAGARYLLKFPESAPLGPFRAAWFFLTGPLALGHFLRGFARGYRAARRARRGS